MAKAPTLIPQRLVSTVAELRQVKAALPVGKYLELLHRAAVTGALPTLDPWSLEQVEGLDGRPLLTPVSVEDRIKILGALVNKVIPDAKTQEIPSSSVDPTAVLKQDLSRLSRDELLGIVAQHAAAQEAEVE